MKFDRLRIGYASYDSRFNMPGDRRRFVHYARSHDISFDFADPSLKYDVVVVTTGADLSLWSRYERNGAKVVFDFIDSYLAIPRTNLKGQLRGLAKFISGKHNYLDFDYWRTLQRMCARADAVVCTTEEQARDIIPFCGNIHVILDIHAGVAQKVKEDYRAGSTFNLVWEGLPVNVESLKLIGGVLRELQTRHEIALHIVTDLAFRRYLGKYVLTRTADVARDICKNVHIHEWSEQMCANVVCACDLAVIPIDLSDPFIAGKPENKLLLFWRMGMPTVVSASPAYQRAMRLAGVPMACASDSEWTAMLERYIGDEAARRQAGSTGRTIAETRFSDTATIQKWDALFEQLLG